MKFTVNLDCTPEEARAFLGLPDIRPLQDKLLKDVEERLAGSVQAMSPDQMLRLWMPTTAGMEQMQAFFSRLTGQDGRS